MLNTIKSMLSLNYDMGNRLKGGDPVIVHTLLQRAGSFGDEFTAYFHAARRISDAAGIGLSIDNILEQHDDDERITLCGKMAIVRAILQAERESRLMSRSGTHGVDIDSVTGTWFERFAQILTENIPRRNAETIFENVSIITFNYDRSIEQYIPSALMRAYGMTYKDAVEIAEKLVIVHPYGSVGTLDRHMSGGGVSFGETDAVDLVEISKNIRTYSERIEDESELTTIREPLRSAEQVMYLGFAFHRQNMDLLSGAGALVKRVYATVMGVSPTEQGFVRQQLADEYDIRPHGSNMTLYDSTCGRIFGENWRGISSPMLEQR